MSLVFTIGYVNQTFTYQPPAPAPAVGKVVVTITGHAVGNTTPVSQSVAEGTTTVTFTPIPDTYSYAVGIVDGSGVAIPGYTTLTGIATVVGPTQVVLSVPGTASAVQQ